MKKRKKKSKPLTLSFLFIVGTIWVFALYHMPVALNLFSIKFINPHSTAFMRGKIFIQPFTKIKFRWADSEEISIHLKNAVVIAEDDRFYEHPGFDWEAIKRAFMTNWKRKRLDFGASTISQQLAKNLYLTPSKDPLRKIREVIIAVFLDTYLSKERILEIYLNVVEWGPNVYGAEAAAKHYFKTHAKNLSPAQSAFLASILPNPVQLGKRGYHLSNRAYSILNRIK